MERAAGPFRRVASGVGSRLVVRLGFRPDKQRTVGPIWPTARGLRLGGLAARWSPRGGHRSPAVGSAERRDRERPVDQPAGHSVSGLLRGLGGRWVRRPRSVGGGPDGCQPEEHPRRVVGQEGVGWPRPAAIKRTTAHRAGWTHPAETRQAHCGIALPICDGSHTSIAP